MRESIHSHTSAHSLQKKEPSATSHFLFTSTLLLLDSRGIFLCNLVPTSVACSHLPLSLFFYVPPMPPSWGRIEEEGRGGCGGWGRRLERKARCNISCAGPNSCAAGGGAGVVLSFPPPTPFPWGSGSSSQAFFCPNPPNLSRRPENVECAVRTCSTPAPLWDNASLA